MNVVKYFCVRCSNILPIDNFYSYKRNICRSCLDKKVVCDFCSKKFNSSNLSKHIKLIHNTYNNSDISESTSKKTNKNKSTSDVTNKHNSTSNITDKNKSTSNTRADLIKSTSDKRIENKSTSVNRTEN